MSSIEYYKVGDLIKWCDDGDIGIVVGLDKLTTTIFFFRDRTKVVFYIKLISDPIMEILCRAR